MEVSCGPTVERWRSDGYSPETVKQMLDNIKAKYDERYVTREEHNRGSEYSEEMQHSETIPRGEIRETKEHSCGSSGINSSSNNNSESKSESDEDDSKCKV